MDANEWLQAQWVKIRRKIDQVVIAALAVLLGITALLWYVEQQVTLPPLPPPPPPQLSPTPEFWPSFMKDTFTHPKDLRSIQELRSVIDFNMFDARSAALQSGLLARLDKQFEQANQAFMSGNIPEAKRILQDIIKEMPSHRRAFELMGTIADMERKQAEAAAKATPARTPPGPARATPPAGPTPAAGTTPAGAPSPTAAPAPATGAPPAAGPPAAPAKTP
ncbi:MAG: hypothetical protein N3D11_09585 [Candidatus Sumerlaeia bacterium]|nr:hypothetical protein [Candidatus Sumerlaeia bacterium]